MSNKVLIFIIAFSLILIAVSLTLINKLDPGVKPKAAADIIKIAPGSVKANEQFMLTKSNGENFTFANLQNKYTIIYFGFTHCPDICPAILSNIAGAIRLFTDEETEKLQFVFVSVDPGRDSLEMLSKFTNKFSDKIIGVTGKSAEIDKLSLSLKAYYAKMASNEKDAEDYLVDHSAFTYLLNPKGELISQFAPETGSIVFAKNIKEIISKE